MSNYRPRISCYSYLVLVIVLTLQLPRIVQSQVLPRDAVVAGKSIPEWGVLKSQWILVHPAGMNPIEDTTGEFSFLGDQGPVFFLDGTFGGPTVTRNVTIRDDQRIHIGLLNTIGWIPVDGETEAEVRVLLRSFADQTDQLFLEIDGVAPAGVNLFDHRQPSPSGLFDLVIPENAIFGLPAGTFPSASDGYGVMLEPLSQGDHTIAFGGRHVVDPNNPFLTSVVYNVRVVPEPSGFALYAACGLLLLPLRRAYG